MRQNHAAIGLKPEVKSHPWGQPLNYSYGQRQSNFAKKGSNIRGAMAKLLIKSPGFDNQVISLNLGVNRFGRSLGNDFVIEHATVSSRHCEIALGDGEVTVRDCGSTNGT